MKNESDPVCRVARILETFGIQTKKLDESTATAIEAANVLGVVPAQIAKSIIIGDSSSIFTILARGDERLNLDRIREISGRKLKLLGKDEVLQRTGFSVGGVSPLGSIEKSITLMDRGLFNYDIVWVAAGSPFNVFECSPERLKEITDSEVADVTL